MKQIIIKPIISEKSMKDTSSNRYTFLVALDAKKEEIKNEVKRLFNVMPLRVSTIVTKGRVKKVGARRVETMVTHTKKAIVQLKKGEKIAVFEAVG